MVLCWVCVGKNKSNLGFAAKSVKQMIQNINGQSKKAAYTCDRQSIANIRGTNRCILSMTHLCLNPSVCISCIHMSDRGSWNMF